MPGSLEIPFGDEQFCEHSLLAEHVLDSVADFIDKARFPDWRSTLGRRLEQLFGSPPDEGAQTWALQFQTLVAWLLEHDSILKELQKLVRTGGQSASSDSEGASEGGSHRLCELGQNSFHAVSAPAVGKPSAHNTRSEKG